MNEPMPNYLDTPETATPPATTTPAKVRKTRKAASKRAPRVIDPRIASVNAAAALARQAIRREDRSERIYRVFTEKRWPQLTPAFQVKTSEFVNAKVTPPLPMN